MDQFDVLQTLGRGSFGVVRKVRRRSDGKTLVVKEMDYGSADEKQKQQIVAEVGFECCRALHYCNPGSLMRCCGTAVPRSRLFHVSVLLCVAQLCLLGVRNM